MFAFDINFMSTILLLITCMGIERNIAVKATADCVYIPHSKLGHSFSLCMCIKMSWFVTALRSEEASYTTVLIINYDANHNPTYHKCSGCYHIFCYTTTQKKVRPIY